MEIRIKTKQEDLAVVKLLFCAKYCVKHVSYFILLFKAILYSKPKSYKISS